MRVLVVHIPVEGKDGASDPVDVQVETRLTDVLNDVTKHDDVIDWRVYGQVRVVGVVPS